MLLPRLIAWAVATALATATPAWAHAVLSVSEPPADATIAATATPPVVRLLFNERVEPGFNSIRIFDAARRRFDTGQARLGGDGSVVEVAVGALPAGSYTVVWQVNSVDGHQIRGFFGFGVDAPPPDEAAMRLLAAARSTAWWRAWVLAVNAVSLLALALWIGALAFMAIARGPWSTGSLDVAGPRLGSLALVAGGVFLAACGVALLNQSATMADSTLLEALASRATLTTLTSTNYGQWWSVRATAAALLFTLAAITISRIAIGDARIPWTTLVGAVALTVVTLVTWPLTGHAGALRTHTWPAVIADLLHLAAAVIWTGGVAALGVTLAARRDPDRGSEWSVVLGRFSGMAMLCVPLLALTGAYGAWRHVASPSQLLSTGYGVALLAKVVIFVAILGLGWRNRRAVRHLIDPSRRAIDDGPFLRRFRRRVRIEAVLLLAIMPLAAWLTSLPPAGTVGRAGILDVSREVGRVRIHLVVRPHQPGRNDAFVTVGPAVGEATVAVRAVTVFYRTLDVDTGLESADSMVMPSGEFHAVITIPAAGRGLFSLQVTPEVGDPFLVEFDTYVAG